jgi:hypothetical protein
MQKLITEKGVFGPYDSIETLEDRYYCDGADFHFAVIGQGVVSDVQDGDFPEAVITQAVPKSVTLKAARKAIILSGVGMADIDGALNTIPDQITREIAKVDWEFSEAIERDSPLVFMMSQVLGLTSEQVDELFLSASNIVD